MAVIFDALAIFYAIVRVSCRNGFDPPTSLTPGLLVWPHSPETTNNSEVVPPRGNSASTHPTMRRLQTAGDISGAKTLYQRALSLHPNSPELLNNLGWLEEQSGGGSKASLETSVGLYMRALGLMGEGSPAHEQVKLNLTNVWKRLKDDAGGQA